MKMDTWKIKDSNDSDSEVSMRPWAEEKEDEVIYNVFLKTPEKSSQAGSCQMVKSRTIKAASVEKLVEYLPTVTEGMDSLYLHTFFSTYLTYTNLQYVLKLLMNRYFEACHIPGKDSDNLKRNIHSVIVTWLEEKPKDFYQPPDHPCLQFLKDVAMETMQDTEFLNKIEQIFKNFSVEEDEENHYFDDPLSPGFSINDAVDFMLQGCITYRHITEIDTKMLAAQLTAMDAALFMKVNPQHCIGSIWSRRDKKSCDVDTYSVKATINQFNEVSNRVMSTVLWDKSLSPSSRAKIICKWIAVSQACRELKNFSSLKAIISGLQSYPIHRLQKTWDYISKPTMQLFHDLAKIFQDDNNFEAWREILMKEGTAKFSPVILSKNGKWSLKGLRRKNSDKSVSQEDMNVIYGTVPYLGTFLTDLEMIDKANPDFIQGLVNFDKRRKEFEIIAQIQLLQNTAKSYNIQPDPDFKEWFENQTIVSYQEYCTLSEDIEAPSRLPQSSSQTPSPKDDSRPKISRKFFSFTAEDYKQRNRKEEQLKTRLWLGGHGKSSSVSSSVSSTSSNDTTPSSDDSVSLSSVESPISFTPINKDKKRLFNSLQLKTSQSLVCLSDLDQASPVSSQYEFPSESCRIIRVTLDSGDEDSSENGNIYKSLVITQQDRAPTIIQSVLSKHNMPSGVSCKDYSLLQMLPNGAVLKIPDNANVFYAMNTSADPFFTLTRKAEFECTSLSSPPLRSKKGLQDSSRLSWVWLSSSP